MRPRITIVNSSSFGRIFPEHLDALERFAELSRIDVAADIAPADLAGRLQGQHGIVASVSPHYTFETMSALPDLRVIVRHGIGYNNIDIDAATECRIVVTKVEGHVEQAAVAEHAVALLLALSRHIPAASAAVRKSRWADRASFVGHEITGHTIGIVGVGNIGRRAAQILRQGFLAKVLAVDPLLTPAHAKELDIEATSLDDLLRRSDFILLHCSLNPDNYHMINAATLARMKPGALLVNTARGELVDSNALANALRDGPLAGYATDVVEHEPIDGDHPLLKRDNVLVVPHLGGYTYESLRGMETMVRNLQEVLCEHTVPKNTVNPTITIKN